MTDRVDLETVFYERVADGVVLLTMNRPDHANGVNPALARDLLDALERFEADRSVRTVVLTGAGAQFSAGADLKALKRYLEERLPVEHEPFNGRVIFPVTYKIASTRIPVIAAVNGGATAGGFDLSLACDIRVASTKAKMGETYIKIGMVPGNGGSYFLPRLVGSGMAAELALTGEVVNAERALQIGLVNRVVEHEQLLEESIALAADIASKPWRALQATKHAMRGGWHMDLQTVLNSSFWSAALLHHTQDFAEGVDAFLEKRPASFGKDEPEHMYWET